MLVLKLKKSDRREDFMTKCAFYLIRKYDLKAKYTTSENDKIFSYLSLQ